MLPRAMASSCSKMRAPSSRMPECAYSLVTHCRMPRICCAVSCNRTEPVLSIASAAGHFVQHLKQVLSCLVTTKAHSYAVIKLG